MYQRILVPVDGSETSDKALQEALKLVAGQPAQLLLLHVLEDMQFLDAEGYVNYAELRELTLNMGKRMLDKAAEIATQAGITADSKLVEAAGERIANVITAEAKDWPADLVVIGTHGRSGFSHLLFGSVAEGVVRGAPVPVLLVRSA
ncbi:MAG: universal stress protein [Gallionellaceae bacterium CG1_02_56_997]|nr:MAG: universal stress protein [Gallionellaceae bacterium CG1_02_56_997]PIX03723.1 MAG: universal stress protein [Gallionellales bacterium CG_4_8_14_3_um_filter_54_18]PJC03520.1 MAG: universal stress protein [Gallionellales bacterium CG_4_9_14_0_8_um_filter_55_61]HCJ51440.1 universal stress protein [Gallionella sp.]